MTIMITEVYDAFLDSGTSETKAKAAAEALAGYDRIFSKQETSQILLKWMIAFNLVFTMAILWKVFS